MKHNGIEEKVSDKMDKVAGKFESKYENLKDRADDYVAKGMAGAESARESLSELTERITQNVESVVNKGLKQAKTASANTEQLVKKYPLYTLAGAATIAFVAGMIYGKVSKSDR